MSWLRYCRSVLRWIAGSSAIGLGSCQTKDLPRGNDSASNATSPPHLASADTSRPRRRILFVGTSLTAGYGLEPHSAFSYLIQRKIDSAGLPFETINAGVSG